MSMISEIVQQLRDEASIQTVDAVYKLLNKAAGTIEELSVKLHNENMERSTAYYNGGWIPIGEGCPKTYTVQYLVCLENGHICMAIFNGEEFKEISTLGMKRFYEENKPIAYMPLPQPYKEGDYAERNDK